MTDYKFKTARELKLDDRYGEGLTYRSQCMNCEHLLGEGRCKAFPDYHSIPLPIWRGEAKHLKPVKGDHGIRYTPMQAGKK